MSEIFKNITTWLTTSGIKVLRRVPISHSDDSKNGPLKTVGGGKGIEKKD